MSSVEQQLTAMQKQMTTLQAQLAQIINPTPTLHSLSTRPHYEWTPSEAQVNILHMDTPIHTSRPMAPADRKAIIETYPPVAQLEYRSPATVPSAEQTINKGQKIEDNSLKHLQYQVSAILRPLDVLAHEMITHDGNNANSERFCAMLADMRSLVVDLCSTITQALINIAYRAVIPSFSVKAESDVGYIVPPEKFQQSVSQQAAAKKAIRVASALRNPRRRFPNDNLNSGSFSNGPGQQFFRPGPPSQQGGFSNNNKKNTSPFRHSFVDTTIQHGYKIQFHTNPPTTTSPTSIHPLSQNQVPLIEQTIQDLLNKQAIELVSPEEVQQTPGFYSSMFVIPKKDEGTPSLQSQSNQPISSCSSLRNGHITGSITHDSSKRLPSLNRLVRRIPTYTVGLHLESRRFLRLKWKGKVYQYRTIAFGLASCPYVFTKDLGSLRRLALNGGLQATSDGTSSAGGLAITGSRMVNQLPEIGSYSNSTVGTPRLCIEYPVNDSSTFGTQTEGYPSFHQASSGQTSSSVSQGHSQLDNAIFPARLYTRHLLFYKNQSVKSDVDWDRPRPLDQASLEELQRWYVNIHKWNGRSMLPSTPNQTMFVDASDTGWGCSWKTQRDHGYWTAEEAAQSINWRKLQAAFIALITFHLPPNSTVLIRTDNTTSLSYINKQEGGPRSLPLMELATLDRGLRVSAPVFQESMDDQAADISTDTASLGTFFHRSIRGQDYEVATKVRVMDAGSSSSLYGCSVHSMDQLPESLRKSSLEPHLTGLEQDQTGTPSNGDSGGTLLAQCSLVPSGSTDDSFFPMAVATTSGADDLL